MFRSKSWLPPNRNSVFICYEQWQYSGNSYKRIIQLPNYLLQTISDRDVVGTIAKLDAFSLHPTCDQEKCSQLLKNVLEQFVNLETRRELDQFGADDKQQSKYAVSLYNCGIVDILLRILMFSSLFPHRARHRMDLGLPITAVALETLTKMTSSTVHQQVTTRLLEQDDILSYMFTLLIYQKTFINTCKLIEDLLLSQTLLLDLNKIYYIQTLVRCLNNEQLASFCRILAIAISDLDIYGDNLSLYAQNKHKRSSEFVNKRDINQELLLSIPELLPRLVGLVVFGAYLPRFPGMVSNLDCWLKWADDNLADESSDTSTDFDDDGDDDDDDDDDFVGVITAATTASITTVQQKVLATTEAMIWKVEVVNVLGLFLLGRHKTNVQRKLADLQLVPGLSDMFDQFIWNCPVIQCSGRHLLLQKDHNADCECSPEVFFMIHFLRLVYNFCSHSDYKHVLLSPIELEEIKRINAKAGCSQLYNLDNINKSLMCQGSQGLLTKIVEVMKKESATSMFRFWLTRVIESYLQGDISYCDQVFLMRRGLLQHVASNIVELDNQHKEIFQSNFDLLNELVKFNKEAFITFDSILSTQQKFDQFINAVNGNLMESNMFIRSLVLSLEHFRSEEEMREYAKKNSKLLTYIGDFRIQLDYIYRLITIIDVQNLTQENVSCLNTVLVFLMLANQKHQLDRYLQALQDEKYGMLKVNGSVKIMTNLRDLLLFWQVHYVHRDCSALEKSSGISFEYWKQTVATLVTDNIDNESTLAHYCGQRPCE